MAVNKLLDGEANVIKREDFVKTWVENVKHEHIRGTMLISYS